MTRTSRFSALIITSAVALSAPVFAYPAGTSLEVTANAQIVTSKTFNINVANIAPGQKCTVLFNKKKTSCTTAGNATSKSLTLNTPSTKGRFKIIATVPTDGEDGRSDSSVIYVASLRAPAASKVGRTAVFSASFLPEGTEVALFVNGVYSGSEYADEDGKAAGSKLEWVPNAKGNKVVTIKADGNVIFSKVYKVSK
jgi:hypothetical protein